MRDVGCHEWPWRPALNVRARVGASVRLTCWSCVRGRALQLGLVRTSGLARSCGRTLRGLNHGVFALWPGRPSMCSLVRSPARRAAWAHGASAGRVRAFPSKADSGFQFLSSFASVLGPAGGPNTPGLASECESSFRSAALSSRIPLNRTGSHPQGPKRRERKGTRLNGCVGKSPREGRGAMEAELEGMGRQNADTLA
jgi:hypothetical protein